jgi:putative peptidoglycan lipid II flippase
MTSRILGFVREMMFAAYFGANRATDAFFIAWRIPNLLRRLVAEGGLTISFIPVYTEYLVCRGEQEALELARRTLSILIIACCLLVALGILFSPQLVGLFAWGFTDPSSLDLAVRLNRILFPYLFFVAMVAFSMGVLNPHGLFFAPAFSPVMLNLGIIGGILIAPFFEEPLYGVCIGVMAGGVAQFLMQIPYLLRSGFRFKFVLDFRHEGIRRIFKLLGPAMFGIAVYQINILMSTILASSLPSGCVSYIYYSDRLTEIVLGVFIISIGNVILPRMSQTTAVDDYEGMKKLYLTSLNAAMFLALPAAAGLMAAGLPIVSVIFMRGSFTYADAILTERALFFAAMGIISVAILRITAPAFYSLKDTRTPVKAATGAFVVNISLGYILMHTQLMHAGLVLANTVAVTGQVTYLLWKLRDRVGRIFSPDSLKNLGFIFISSAVMAVVVLLLVPLCDWQRDPAARRWIFLFLVIAAAGGTFFAVARAMGVSEILYVLKRLKGRRAAS